MYQKACYICYLFDKPYIDDVRVSQVALVVKKKKACLSMQERLKRHWFDPWVKKIPWRRAWQPTPVFLSGESHGQSSLVGYSPWGHKGSDMTVVAEHNTVFLCASLYVYTQTHTLPASSSSIHLSVDI